jgi:hypothetical protein
MKSPRLTENRADAIFPLAVKSLQHIEIFDESVFLQVTKV